ncbi:MAG: hypothetical protein ACLGP3_08200 [Acidobacteriota bacterium]|jgi:hypothetical protein
MSATHLFHRLDDVGADAGATAFCEALAGDGMTLAAAVVPDWLTAGQAKRLVRLPDLAVLQHGVSHANRRRLGYPDEFPDSMPDARMRHLIVDGRHRLEDAFSRAVIVYVPPWNRISHNLCRVLVEAGFEAVSGHSRFPVARPLRNASATIDAVRHYAPLRLHALHRLTAAIEAATAATDRRWLGVFYHVGGLTRGERVRAVAIARRLGELYPVADLLKVAVGRDY